LKNPMKKIFKIKGMHCNSCAQRIEEVLKEKVNKIIVSYSKEQAEINFDENKISEKEIKDKIIEAGYEIKEDIKQKKSTSKVKIDYFILVGSVLLLIYVLYFFVGKFDVSIPKFGENTGLALLFFTGVLTGFHCVSMCGGFVVSYTAKNALKGHKSFKQHLVYGGSKVISYAIMGGLFGLIGGIIAFNIKLRGTISILAGLFMIFYAFGMMGIGFFKKFQFNPKFLMKATSKISKEAKGPYKAPFVTGLLSGLFLACGPLQAMYLYAAGSGSFFTGTSSLLAFGLGTLPVMLGFGSLTTVISYKTTRKILKFSSIIVLILGVIMLNRGLTVMGSPVSYDSLKNKITEAESSGSILVNGYQEINMEVNKYGWEPNSFILKKGVPVKWNINVKQLKGCNNEIIVDNYGLDIKLKQGLNVVEFTPDKEGTVRWSCWMGMIPGNFLVTKTGSASKQELTNAVSQSSGSCGGSCGSSTCSVTNGGICGCGG